MTAVLLGRAPLHSPAWYQMRSTGIGGSEIAAVVGLSPWVSKYALYLRKRGEIPEQPNQPKFDWGHRLEPVIADVWADLHGDVRLLKAGTYQHADRPWQLANVDRLVYNREAALDLAAPLKAEAVWEGKTAHQYDAHEWGYGPEDIPPYYRCQCLWYADVFGGITSHLAVLIGGSDYREYTIPYVADEAEWLREEGRKFWDDVLAGDRPAIDEHDATYKAVRAQHPDIERDVDIDLDPAVYDAYATTKTDADQAKGQHQKAKAVLLDQMGSAQRALVDGFPVLRRQPGRGGTVSLYPIKEPKGATA